MKYQLAIFDLDGTLLDTLEDLADSTNGIHRISDHAALSPSAKNSCKSLSAKIARILTHYHNLLEKLSHRIVQKSRRKAKFFRIY